MDSQLIGRDPGVAQSGILGALAGGAAASAAAVAAKPVAPAGDQLKSQIEAARALPVLTLVGTATPPTPDAQTTADGETLRAALAKTAAGKLTNQDLAAALTSLTRSYTPENVTLAGQLDARIQKSAHAWELPLAEEFRLVHHAFSTPLQGATLHNGRYADPTAMLVFGQSDPLSMTVSDQDRCGAASVVAAAIVQGPAALQQLADRYQVRVDVQQPTRGPLYLLMEQIYTQTRTATAQAQPGQPEAVPGLQPPEVQAILRGLAATVEPETFVRPQDLNLTTLSVAVVGIAAPSRARDHGILIYRDPVSGKLAKYEPAVRWGIATTLFPNDAALTAYLESVTLVNRPGQVAVMGTLRQPR